MELYEMPLCSARSQRSCCDKNVCMSQFWGNAHPAFCLKLDSAVYLLTTILIDRYLLSSKCISFNDMMPRTVM